MARHSGTQACLYFSLSLAVRLGGAADERSPAHACLLMLSHLRLDPSGGASRVHHGKQSWILIDWIPKD